MEWQLVWFLLAGFVLGFATSMLWEWVYYRGVRRRNLAARQSSALEEGARPPLVAPVTMAAFSAETPAETGYRSPAVFIEGEQPASAPAIQPTYESVSTPWNAAVSPTASLDSASPTQPDHALPATEPVESTPT